MISRKRPTSKSSKIRVGITMGDPSGIGPEIALEALLRLKGAADFTLIGDACVLAKIKNSCLSGRQEKLKIKNFRLVDLKNVPQSKFSSGKIRPEYGKASLEYLDTALRLIRQKEIDCLVTCPLCKEAVSLAGFSGFSGHTEYLAKASGVKDFSMLLLNRQMKFSLVTRHIPLSRVSRHLCRGTISRNIVLAGFSLKKLFAIPSPRIVVCALNPHASDNSLIGNEEAEIIGPAMALAAKKIRHLFGPYPADTAIASLKQKKYDCAVSMYHDQALIPLKLSGIDNAVNMTLGLPFIRTSPLHGTAFDIAGKGIASAASLIEAVRLAIRCTSNLKKA